MPTFSSGPVRLQRIAQEAEIPLAPGDFSSPKLLASPKIEPMKLPPGWYGFCSVRSLSKTKISRLERFGSHWAVWWHPERNSWVVQADRCPHRSASLSAGRIVRTGAESCLECPFHGFQFNGQGTCTHVPEIGRDAPGLRVKTLSTIEKHGFVWTQWDQTAQKTPPWFEDLNENNYTFAESSHLWNSHFTRAVESQLDYAHLPFIHRNSIGRSFDPKLKVEWEFGPDTLRVHLGKIGPRTGFFEFAFPNLWRLQISSKIVQTLVFAPINENSTMIYARSYHRFTRIPVLRAWVAWISAKIVNPMILGQDQRVVEQQVPADVASIGGAERLFPSDKAIVAFRSWLSNPPSLPLDSP